MITLLGRRSSLNVQKVLWSLLEIGVPFEHEELGGRFGGLQTDRFLALNPNGRIPVLVRGGGKAPDAEILDRTEKLMQQGASGIVYGRNIIQHRNPAGMTRALMAIVHDGATAAEAASHLEA